MINPTAMAAAMMNPFTGFTGAPPPTTPNASVVATNNSNNNHHHHHRQNHHGSINSGQQQHLQHHPHSSSSSSTTAASLSSSIHHPTSSSSTHGNYVNYYTSNADGIRQYYPPPSNIQSVHSNAQSHSGHTVCFNFFVFVLNLLKKNPCHIKDPMPLSFGKAN